MNLQDMLHSRNVHIERSVLCQILTTRRLPIGFKIEHFDCAERSVFDECAQMYRYNGDIDSEIVAQKYPDAVSQALNLRGTYSRHALQELENHKRIRDAAKAIAEFANFEDVSESIRDLQSKLSDTLIAGSAERYNHSKSCTIALEQIQDRAMGKKDVIGYRCSLSDVDKLLGGFQKGKAYYIGALKKTGKTRFVTYLASQFLEQGAKIVFNSVEMGPVDLNLLRYSYYAGVDAPNITDGAPKRTLEKIATANSRIISMPWFICRHYTVEELRAELAHQKVNGGCDVVFVDFIQQMRSSAHRGDRVREVESIARGLADIARDEDVAMIALTQLSGEAEKIGNDKVPSMAFAKESQAIGECCDWFITLHNYNRGESPFDATGNTKKLDFGIRLEGRYNASGSIARVTADLATCRFSDRDMQAAENAAWWNDG